MFPEVMSGVYLTRHGGPDALEWRDDIPVPPPGAGQVLVKVLAAGVNNTDINTRVGWYPSDVSGATEDVGESTDIEDGGWGGAIGFPRIQGGDICGAVVAVGDDVISVGLGARVTSQINIPKPTPDNPFAYVALGSELDGAFAEYCLLQDDEIFDVSASPLSNEEIAAIPCAQAGTREFGPTGTLPRFEPQRPSGGVGWCDGLCESRVDIPRDKRRNDA